MPIDDRYPFWAGPSISCASKMRCGKSHGKERMLRAVLHPAIWKVVGSKFGRKRQGQTRRRRRQRGSLLSSGSGSELKPSLPTEEGKKNLPEVHLVSEIWKRLPQELIEKVLVRLPHSHFVACRSVCKVWNEYIVSTPLSPVPEKAITTPVHFLPNGDFLSQPLTVYNPTSFSWEKHSLSFLKNPGPHSLVAADGGLLCFADSCWENFVICNPVSKQWKLLRPPVRVVPDPEEGCIIKDIGNYVLVGMVVNREESSYKVVVSGLAPPRFSPTRKLVKLKSTMTSRSGEIRCRRRSTLIYDSCTDSWTEGAVLQLTDPEIIGGIWRNSSPSRSVSCNGMLYWSIVEEGVDVDNEDIPGREMVRFDIDEDIWRKSDLADDHELRNLIVLAGKNPMLLKLYDGVELSFNHCSRQGLRGLLSGIGSKVRPGEWEYMLREAESGDEREDLKLKKVKLPKKLIEFKRRNKVTSGYDNRYCCIGQGTTLFVFHQLIDGAFSKAWEMQGWKVLRFDSEDDSCVWLPHLSSFVDDECGRSWWTLQPSLGAGPQV